MSTIRVVNVQHTDATEPNIVLQSDGTSIFASGITISGGTNLTVSGTAEFASGTVSAPGITFIDDNNTGIYEPAADTVAITTGGTERLRVDSTGNIGIGTTTPVETLEIQSATNTTLRISNQDDSTSRIYFRNVGSTDMNISVTNAEMTFNGGSNERMRIDSSGRLLVATTTSMQSASTLQVSRANGNGIITIGRDDVSVSAGNGIGAIDFYGNAGGTYQQCARILAIAEDTHALGDKATGFAFYTNGGGSSATERMRIDSSGNVGIGTTSPAAKLQLIPTAVDTDIFAIRRQDSTNINLFRFFQDSNVAQGTGAAHLNTENRDLILTAAPTAGIDDGIYVKTTGEVGIGNSSPGNYSGVAKDLVVGNHSGAHGITIAAQSNNAGYLSWADGTNTTAQQRAGRISYSHSTNSMRFGTNASERMRIDSSGRLLIGTTSASSTSHALQVKSSDSAEAVKILGRDSDDISQLNFYEADGSTILGGLQYRQDHVNFRHRVGDIRFATGGTTERMRIDSAGRVLLGLTTNLNVGNLQVKETIAACRASNSTAAGQNIGTINFADSRPGTYGLIKCQSDGSPGASDYPGRLMFFTTPNGSGTPKEYMRISQTGAFTSFTSGGFHGFKTNATSASSEFLRFQNNSSSLTTGTTVARVRADGDLENANNSYTGLSDVKLKENIVDASSQWEDIKTLRVRNYNFKQETGFSTHTQLGVIAQELETVSPGLVKESPDLDNEGNDLGTTTKSVNYSVLYMKAVKALQEAMDRIETLEAKVTALEAG